jgi:hypothetical protein
MYKENEKVTVNRNYKDTVFRSLFREKRNCLELYNALNGSNYENEDELEIVTLENAIYLSQKNDLAFILDYRLHLYEHQSSYNPNMPLRGFLYFADLYREIIKDNEKIYSPQLVRIPNPKYIVFYNGPRSKMDEDSVKLRLSDCFEVLDKSGDFEWTATMININAGHNHDLLEKCDILKQYTIFIEKVKEYNKSNDLADAINQAMEVCIAEGVLADVLSKQKREGQNVVLTEFDQEKYDEMIKEIGREEGQLDTYCRFVAKKRISLQEALQECNLTKEEFLAKMEELGLTLPE